MIRVTVFVLLVVAAGVAYPWVAAGLVVGGVVLAVGVSAGRARRKAPAGRAGAGVEHVSLVRRVALRQARAELRGIERGAGLDDY